MEREAQVSLCSLSDLQPRKRVTWWHLSRLYDSWWGWVEWPRNQGSLSPRRGHEATRNFHFQNHSVLLQRYSYISPAILLLGICPRKMKAYIRKKFCTRIEALFITAPSTSHSRVHHQAVFMDSTWQWKEMHCWDFLLQLSGNKLDQYPGGCRFDPWPRSVDEGPGVAVSSGVAGRCGSDLMLLWLWCRSAAISLIDP